MQPVNCVRVLWLVPLWLVLCCCPGAARGDAVPQRTLDQARLYYQRGAAAYEAGRYQQALGEFQRSYRLSHLPALLYNLALVEEKMGDVKHATAHLQQYLQTPDIPDRAEVLALLGRMHGTQAPPEQPPPSDARRPEIVPPGPDGRERPKDGPRPLWVSGWTVGGAGLLAAVVGGALLGVDGSQDCGQAPRQCKQLLDTRTGGIALLTGGLVMIGTATVLLILDHRRSHHRALLVLRNGAF